MQYNQALKPDLQTPKQETGGFADMVKRPVAGFQHEGRDYLLSCHATLKAFDDLKEGWHRLERVSPEPFDYFQTFDWCHKWARTFCAGGNCDELRIYALECEGELALVWPFVLTHAGFGNVRILEPVSEPMGQYANLLYDADMVDTQVGRKAWAHLKADQQADAVYLKFLPLDGMLSRIIGEEGVSESDAPVSSFLDYSQISDWEEYEASFSKSQRKQRRSRKRKLEALGELRFDVYFHDHENFVPVIERAIELKRDWLKDMAKHSQSLFEDRATRFLSSLGSPEMASGQGPMVHVLSLDGVAIGIEIGALRGRHYYSYLGAIDLEYGNYSPGKVQMAMSQKWGFETGLERYDYLCDPSDYKVSWTNKTVAMDTRYIPLTFVGNGYCGLWKARLRPVLRKAYHHSPENLRRSLNRLLEFAGKGADPTD